jgi:CRISPR/Cas system-associated exonuclease Cas4 (RecB family)
VAEAIEAMDPLQRGSLVHEVQFTLLTALEADGLLPLTAATVDGALARLDTVVDETAMRYHDDLAPAIERVWNDGVASIRADLRAWLRAESERDDGFAPWRFELSFGLPGRRARDPHSVDEPAELECGIRLRGSIDLVERGPAGMIRVTDHKTGRSVVPEGAIVDGGRSLQPVLYALAAEQVLAPATVTEGRLFYCTNAAGFTVRDVPLDAAARRSAQVVAGTIDGALRDGFFPAMPDDRACDWCDYRAVCGPAEAWRTKRKPADRIEPLVRLRTLP